MRHIGTKPIAVLLSSRACGKSDLSSLTSIHGEGGGPPMRSTSPAHHLPVPMSVFDPKRTLGEHRRSGSALLSGTAKEVGRGHPRGHRAPAISVPPFDPRDACGSECVS